MYADEIGNLKKWVEENPYVAAFKINELAEKIERLNKIKDAKIALISNRLEEKMYVLQETCGEYEKAIRFAVKYLKSSDIKQVQMVVKQLESVIDCDEKNGK